MGDLVIRKVTIIGRTTKKLDPNWEGLFLVLKRTQVGSHRLVDQNGKDLLHIWYHDNLKRYYV